MKARRFSVPVNESVCALSSCSRSRRSRVMATTSTAKTAVCRIRIRLKAASQFGSIGRAPNGNGKTPTSGMRLRKIAAIEPNKAMMPQREGKRSSRPRQNSTALMAAIGPIRAEDNTTR